MLYEKYSESIRIYLEANVKKDLDNLGGPELLQALNQKWQDHQIMVKWMRSFFQYLDRFYVEMHSTTKLGDQGLKIFKEIVFQPLCYATTGAFVNEIKK